MRAPSLVQLYDSVTGNPALTMEKATTGEVGLGWKPPTATTADAVVFHSKIRNFIQSDDMSGVSINRERYRLTGLELSLRAAVAKTFNAGASYAYLKGRDLSPGATFDELQYRPQHKLALEGRWRFMPSAWLSASVLHVRDQVYFSRTGPARIATLPSYTLTALQASYAVPSTSVTLYAGARNLFDKLYFTSYGFPQEGRTLYAGLRAGF